MVNIEVEIGDDRGRKVKSVYLSGQAVEVIKGTVCVPSVEA